MAGLRDGQRQDLSGNMKGFRSQNERTVKERGIIVSGGLGARKLDEEGLTNVWAV